MKLALITDTHYGVRADNISFLNNSKKFLDDIFFPTIKTKGVDSIVHLGDLVDRRKYINVNTAKRLHEDFLNPIEQSGIPLHLIAGNHDTFYKNTNEVNALREFVSNRYSNFHIYDNHASEVNFDGTDILFLPWICDENKTQIFDRIKNTNAQIAFGHLELAGFEMFRGSQKSHGDDPSIFSRFDLVCSGHYHHKSSIANIHYLGNHAQFTWSDCNDPKGYHIFDAETREIEFIENPYVMFRKVFYSDKNKNVLEHDFAQYKDCYVKVIVQVKEDPFAFDLFTTKISEAGPLDISIVDDHHNIDKINEEDLIGEAEDTLTILSKYIKTLETNVDKKTLEDLLRTLYNESIHMETE